MKSQYINEFALKLLYNHDWIGAQKLFFENAKKYPSHETFNNLGYFLITEGLSLKKGISKNAFRLGKKYLYKALSMRNSVINLSAITVSLNLSLARANSSKRAKICRKACIITKKALSIKYSNEMQYNYLRFLYIMNPKNPEVLPKMKILLDGFICEEAVSFYLELLRVNSIYDRGIILIKKYKNILDIADLLIFYTSLGKYEEGYLLCNDVYNQYALNDVLASSIIECCVNTGNYKIANEYAEKFLQDEIAIHSISKKVLTNILSNLNKSTKYRTDIITNYRCIPAFIDSCCYFGCIIHKTNWM